MPSLKQLSDAVEAFMAEHPDDLITVVVDATFGHRIDASEVDEFEAAIEHNEMVSPPAGAVGRGDGFVLAIADKVNARVLSNDSYQEFHGQYDWLFDEGRLIGGKPVPHVGWVFVDRVPVRGPLSRKSQRDARRGKDAPREPRQAAGRGTAARPVENTVRTSPASNQPMPVPKAPPPGAKPPRGSVAADTPLSVSIEPAATSAAPPAPPARNAMINDLLPFLEFVEKHPVGSIVTAEFETYSSHGVYVLAAGARAYLPLRNISDPAPRTARERFKLGETAELQVAAFHAPRRGIDVAVPGVIAGLETPPAAKPSRGRRKTAEAPPAADVGSAVPSAVEATDLVDATGTPAPKARGRRGATAEVTPDVAADPAPVEQARPTGRRGARPAPEPAVDESSAAAVKSMTARRRGRPGDAPPDAQPPAAALEAGAPAEGTDPSPSRPGRRSSTRSATALAEGIAVPTAANRPGRTRKVPTAVGATALPEVASDASPLAAVPPAATGRRRAAPTRPTPTVASGGSTHSQQAPAPPEASTRRRSPSVRKADASAAEPATAAPAPRSGRSKAALPDPSLPAPTVAPARPAKAAGAGRGRGKANEVPEEPPVSAAARRRRRPASAEPNASS